MTMHKCCEEIREGLALPARPGQRNGSARKNMATARIEQLKGT